MPMCMPAEASMGPWVDVGSETYFPTAKPLETHRDGMPKELVRHVSHGQVRADEELLEAQGDAGAAVYVSI